MNADLLNSDYTEGWGDEDYSTQNAADLLESENRRDLFIRDVTRTLQVMLADGEITESIFNAAKIKLMTDCDEDFINAALAKNGDDFDKITEYLLEMVWQEQLLGKVSEA